MYLQVDFFFTNKREYVGGMLGPCSHVFLSNMLILIQSITFIPYIRKLETFSNSLYIYHLLEDRF